MRTRIEGPVQRITAWVVIAGMHGRTSSGGWLNELFPLQTLSGAHGQAACRRQRCERPPDGRAAAVN